MILKTEYNALKSAVFIGEPSSSLRNQWLMCTNTVPVHYVSA